MFERVQAAAVDGRQENVFWRQIELQKLYKVLAQQAASIQAAIVKDSATTRQEAKLEFCEALLSVKRRHAELQPDHERTEEYSIANGKDSPNARRPYGLVYIVPTTHTMFYSTITAISAAIAAGNCCIVEIEQTSRKLSPLLSSTLKEALDPDIFAVATSKAKFDAPEDTFVYFDQSGSARRSHRNDLVSPNSSRVIAVVDRTADLEEAAKALVMARFGFGGKSPYAPDLILVNEFCKQDFLKLAAKHAFQFMADREHPSGRRDLQDLVSLVQKANDGTRIITSGSNGMVVDITKGNATALKAKLGVPCLVVQGVSSLDRSFDIARGDGKLLAGYYFGTPEVIKYLSQFIESGVSFGNHVPVNLLLGPAAPTWPENATADDRTKVQLFTYATPRFIQHSESSKALENALTSESSTALGLLEQTAMTGVTDFKRRPVGGSIGFFEQGILVGLCGVLATVASVIGLSVYGYRSHWIF